MNANGLKFRRPDRIFFGLMGLAMILTVFVGFAPSFYLPGPDAKPLTPLFQLHGLIATAWMLFFMTQTSLIAGHRVDIHRRLGVIGGALAVLMAVVTTLGAIEARGITERLIFPGGAVLMFVIYVTCGLIYRRDAETHKRPMLLATIAVLPPALARMHVPLLPKGTFTPNFLGLLFLLPPLAFDLATQRKIHPALLWGGLFMILMLPLRFFLRDYL